jgi:signal transduction histidine kinase
VLLRWVAVPSLAAMTLLVVLFGLQKAHSVIANRALTRTLLDTVAATAREHVGDAMLLGGNARTALWLRTLGSIDHVTQVHLVSPAYRIAVSADPADAGRAVEDGLMRAGFASREVQVERDESQYRLVVPLENQASCQPCHGPSARVLGALDLRVRSDAGVPEPFGSFLLFAAVLILVSLGGAAAIVLWASNRYLATPLARLSKASRAITAGEGEPAEVGEAPEELRQLAADLNSMARQIRQQSAAVAHSHRDSDQVRVLAGIGEMAARVAHEVRNPLNGIEGAAFYLGNRFTEDPEATEYVGLIRTEVARISAVAADLLSAARPVAPTLERFDFAELARERCRLMALLQPEGNSLSIEASGPSVWVFGDRRQLSQVVDNLVENAVHAVDGTGRVRVLLSLVEVSALQQNARLVVEDDGPGLSEDARAKLFTPFFTTKPRGTGLGLIIVRKIVEAHRGSLAIESAAGQGTRMVVELPV